MSGETLRLDKWLWYARFFKSRSLATRFCTDKRIRINQAVLKKTHHGIRVGDVLTFAKGPHVRVIQVLALGTRRGPAVEAQALYEDLAPPPVRTKAAAKLPAAARDPGAGRPTKADRRAIERLKGD